MSANIINIAANEARKRSRATKEIEKSGLFYMVAGLASCMVGAFFAQSVVGSEGWYYSGWYVIAFAFAMQCTNYAFHLIYKVREYKRRLYAEEEIRLKYQEMLMAGAIAPSKPEREDPGVAEFVIFRAKEGPNGALVFEDKSVSASPKEWINLLEMHPPQTEDEYQKLRDCLKGKDGKAWTDCRLDLLNARKKV